MALLFECMGSVVATRLTPPTLSETPVIDSYRILWSNGRNVTKGPARGASATAAVEISPFQPRGDTVTVKDDPLAEVMRFLLDAQRIVQEVSP